MQNRGFQKVSEYLNQEIIMPQRKTKFSAGYDFHILEDTLIKPGEKKVIPTGIKAFMLEDEVLKIYIRSSLAFKKNLQLINQVGIIDADYYNNQNNEGHILIGVINQSNEDIYLTKNEAIAQGIFEKYLTVIDEKITNVREGGFGSTNEK